MFLLSGAAALVYQVAWQRLLALQSGVGIYSVALITAAFMAGLGIGSQLGGVLSARLSARQALGLFAALEASAALFAHASVPLYHSWLPRLAGPLYASAWTAGPLHFLALLPPTTLMGMSLPCLVRALVRRADTAARTVGWLYAVNVMGAALGAVATPWLLVRHLGIGGAVNAAALANWTAAALGLALQVRAEQPAPAPTPVAPAADATEARPFAVWAALYALSGFIALGLEILWFRLTEVSVKATAFTFGTVLAFYLAGLAGGTALGVALLPRWRRPLRVFLLCQCGLLLYAGAMTVALVFLPPHVPLLSWLTAYWREPAGFRLGRSWDPSAALRLYVAWPLLLYVPATVLMGLSFTALQKAVHDDVRTSGRKVGLLQAANIAGCTAGSLLIGLVGLRVGGTPGSLRTLLALGIVFAFTGWRAYGRHSLFGALGVLLALAAAAQPGSSRLWSRLLGSTSSGALVAEDASGVAAVTPLETRSWRVWVGGRSNSTLPFGGVHSRLGAVAALVLESPAHVAIIGLGSGDTAWAAGVRPETRDVTVMELCAPQLGLLWRLNGAASLPHLDRFLRDPRFVVITADGRRELAHRRRGYDLIEGDALFPESAYSGNLYSREFFALAASRLNRGGAMCTWVPSSRVYHTFCEAFPHVLEFDQGEILLGSRDPLPLDVERWVGRARSMRTRWYLGERVADEVRASLETARRADPARYPARLVNEDLFPRDEFANPD
jgi:spermidine synthase